MITRFLNADAGPKPESAYSQAVEVSGITRVLHISGQVAASPEGVPVRFEDQAALVWRHIQAQLEAAGMSFTNLAKLTIVLTDRADIPANAAARSAALGAHHPASTLIVAALGNPEWKLEIEAIAYD